MFCFEVNLLGSFLSAREERDGSKRQRVRERQDITPVRDKDREDGQLVVLLQPTLTCQWLDFSGNGLLERANARMAFCSERAAAMRVAAK